MEEILKELKLLSDSEIRAKCKELEIKVAVVNKSTRKIFEKKIAKALSNGSNTAVQPNSGSSGETVAPSEQTEPVQEKKEEPVAEDVPDGKFYSIKTDNENMIFKSKKSWDNKLSELRKAKVKNINFRGFFLSESAANEWLVNPNFQTPIKLTRKPLLFSGKVESPLRKPREEIEKQFVGEVRCPFAEPDQKVLNAIDSKIKEKGEGAKDFIIEEIIKNPRILINKSHNPTIFKPGMWYNLAHLLCQYDMVETLKTVLDLVRDPKQNSKLFQSNENAKMILDDIYLKYLTNPAVGPNQRTTRGDRPIHLAARSSSFQILEFFKTLPEYAQMKESLNVERLRPIDIVNEKEDTEVKSKLLGMFDDKVLVAVNLTEETPVPHLIVSHATEAELLNSPGIRALAGPMTPDDASRFVRSVTPSRSKRNPMKFTQDQKTRAAILKDHEKGIEKIARLQAEANGYSWVEKWDFLSDSYVNLQTTDGLERLEAHLATKMAEKMENDENIANLDDTIDDISSKFSSLSVSNGIYLVKSFPTKTDNQVFKSFQSSRIKKEIRKFNFVKNWYQEIANFPESVRQKWPQVKQRHNSKPSTPIPSEKQTLFNTPLSSIPQRQPRRLDQKVDSDPRKRLLF